MKSINTHMSEKRPLVLLGFSVILLLLLVTWSLKVGPFSSFFKVEEAVICQELGDNREPLLIGNSIKENPDEAK